MSACLEQQDVIGPIVTDAPAWSGAARSIVEFPGGCWFGFEVPRASVGVIVGLNTENLGAHFLEIDHAFHFSRGTVRTVEAGNTSPGVGPISYAEGDRFYIMRLGSEVLYMHRPNGTGAEAYFLDRRFPGKHLPGGVLYVSGQPSYGTVFLDVSMYLTGDRIINEAAGSDLWEASAEAGGGGGAALALPFTVVFAAGFGAWATLDLLFDVTAESATTSGVLAELPFTVLGSATTLESLIITSLPFTVTAEGSEDGGSFYAPISGVTGYLAFEVEAWGSIRNAGMELRLPFTLTAYGTSAGRPLDTGALLRLPLNLFMTGHGGSELPIRSGASLGIPFEVLATGSDPTDLVITAGAWLDLPFVMMATGHADDDVPPSAGMYGELLFTVLGSGSEVATNYFNIGLTFNATASVVTEADIEEIFFATSVPAYVFGANLLERLRALSDYSTFYNPQAELAEAITIAALEQLVVALNIADNMSVTDAMAFHHAVAIAEQMVVDGQAQTLLHAIGLVADALTIADASRYANPESVAEAMASADAVVTILRALATLAESVSAVDTIQSALTIVVNEEVGMDITDDQELLAHYMANMNDALGIWAGFKLGDEAFTGWVMNAEGSNPISEYTNYPFNSFCELGGQYYGASENGLYLLEGPDDVGTAIDASVLSRMIDFNSTKMKRVPTAYVGYTTDGNMVLRVRAVSGGELREHWFTATHRNAEAPREQVIQLGRGIRSRYWQFELANVDGADFELDKLELYPVFLNRRT